MLGLSSACVYLAAFALPYWLPSHYLRVEDDLFALASRQPWRGLLFYLALAALFALYVAALRLSIPEQGGGRRAAWIVLLWTAVFCLVLIPVQPLTSSDVYGYLFQGRIVAMLGENPFAHLYKDFTADPFYFCVTFHNLPATTGYGPLWVAVEAALGWLARDRLLLNLFLFKGLAATLHMAGAGLVYAGLRGRAPGARLAAMVFYAWNPLLLFELVGNAHNDAAVAALAIAGFGLVQRRRWWWAGSTCLALAALVKPVALLWWPVAAVWLIAPCCAWPSRLRRAGVLAATAVLPAVAAYAPFWAGAATFAGLAAQSDIRGNSIPNLVVQALWSAWPAADQQIARAVKGLSALVFLPFYLGRLRAARHELILAALDVMLLYLLLVGFQFMPWYVTWILVPAALLPGPLWQLRRRVTVVLSALALLLYFPFGWQWVTSRLSVAAVALLAALPLLALGVWLASAWYRWRRGVRR